MTETSGRAFRGLLGPSLAAVLLLGLLLPVVALCLAPSSTDLWAGVRHVLFLPALLLSLKTTGISLLIIVVTGTPLAFWLCSNKSAATRMVEVVIDLPVVIPPAVVGVALLQAYGQQGLLGPILSRLNIQLPFSQAAVVMSQVVVAAPFYVQAAATAFRKVDQDLLIVARTLGATSRQAFMRVAVPIALPGLFSGAGLAWARALGEFGATLLFAGNMPGRTQTLPVAIYAALETDMRVALAISLCLAASAVGLLLALRFVPRLLIWTARPLSKE